MFFKSKWNSENPPVFVGIRSITPGLVKEIPIMICCSFNAKQSWICSHRAGRIIRVDLIKATSTIVRWVSLLKGTYSSDSPPRCWETGTGVLKLVSSWPSKEQRSLWRKPRSSSVVKLVFSLSQKILGWRRKSLCKSSQTGEAGSIHTQSPAIVPPQLFSSMTREQTIISHRAAPQSLTDYKNETRSHSWFHS